LHDSIKLENKPNVIVIVRAWQHICLQPSPFRVVAFLFFVHFLSHTAMARGLIFCYRRRWLGLIWVWCFGTLLPEDVWSTIVDKVLGTLMNSTNCMCFTTEVWKKRCSPFKNALLFPLPTQSEEIAGSSFQHCMGVEGEARQLKLYLSLACAQKRQKCKFVPRLLSMTVVFLPKKPTL